MQSPFRYPGAKNKILPTLALELDPLLQNNDSFVDVFVGGGSVSLHIAKLYPSIRLSLNDLDEWIFSFWKFITQSNDKDFDKFLLMLSYKPTIEQFYRLSDTMPKTEIDKAYRALFFNRCCFSGIVKRNGHNVLSSPIGGKQQLSKYTVDCRYNSIKIIEKVKECRELLIGRTTVTNNDFSTTIKNNNNSVLYLDPPYRKAGKELYNEYIDDNQHIEMSNLLQHHDKWLLSYDDDPFIRNLYKRNQVNDLSMRYSINGKKESWSGKNELLITK